MPSILVTENWRFTLLVPDVIRIEPSSACNIRCVHCPTGQGYYKGNIMSEDTFNIIMDNLKDNVPRVVVMYHGGEPLLCKNIWDWVARLKHLGVKKVKTVTNGTLMDIESVKRIITCGLDEIEISLDGESKEENEAIRQGSNTDQVIENVARLVDIKYGLGSDTPDIYITNTQFSVLRQLVPGIPEYLKEAFSVAVNYKIAQAITWPGLHGGGFQPTTSIVDGNCPHLNETMTIRANGDVVACCYDITSGYVLGNVISESLENIRNGKRCKRVYDGLKNVKPVKICKGCVNE